MSLVTKSTESPFTWGLDKNEVLNLDEANELYDDVDEEPVLALVNSIMFTYCRATKGDYNAAKIKNIETEEIWSKLDLRQIQNEGISTKVLEHIKNATAYHLFNLSGDRSKASRIMATLTDFQRLHSSLGQSTLEGCKAIAWLLFHEASYEIALRHIEEAMSSSPKCPLWLFLAGKCYRYARRTSEFSWKPSEQECRAFLRCRELSKRPFYAIFVAQMYRENGDTEICQQMYKDIYNDCRNKSTVVCVGALLRLALAFTRSKDFIRANECLQRVEKIKPKNSMFLHYKGIYLMKMRHFELAKEYLQEATKNGNYSAEMDLIACNKSLYENFNCIEHLRKMMKKYESNKYFKMQCLLHIAMQYYSKKNYLRSADYFQKALLLDIDDKQLKSYRNVTVNWKYYNIFNFVCDHLLTNLRRNPSTSSNSMMISFLETVCKSRKEVQPKMVVELEKSFNTMNLR